MAYAEPIYVTMTDNFMSGWGDAKGKQAVYCVVCMSEIEAETILRNAKKRSEMSRVKRARDLPRPDATTQVTVRRYHELGGVWHKGAPAMETRFAKASVRKRGAIGLYYKRIFECVIPVTGSHEGTTDSLVRAINAQGYDVNRIEDHSARRDCL